MVEAEFLDAVSAGYEALSPEADLVVLGEMGIGNTTSASAIAAALFCGGGARFVGHGTGVDESGLKRKQTVIDAALGRHHAILDDPLRIAAALGGRELAAILGAALAARHWRSDRSTASAAAVAPLAKAPRGAPLDAMRSPVTCRPSRGIASCEELALRPLLDLGMRQRRLGRGGRRPRAPRRSRLPHRHGDLR
jgi:nicotinate-nucleotide--dimethylbenzimidazole phosphoribosyltransferase